MLYLPWGLFQNYPNIILLKIIILNLVSWKSTYITHFEREMPRYRISEF